TALSATHITAEDLQRAREYNAQMKAQVDHLDPHEFTELNRSFHGVLTAACPNARLLQLIDAEWGRLNYLRDSIFSFVPERTQESVREHEYLVQLIESGASQNETETACRHPGRLPGPRTSRTASRTLRLLTNLEDAMTATTPAGHHTPENLPEHIQHYIDGEFVDSADGATFDVLDPVTNQNYLKAAAGKQ